MNAVKCMGAILALSLTSCAMDSERSNPPGNAAIEAEKARALDDYDDCIMDAARKLDDAGSDPSLTALAVQPDCMDQFARYVKISGTGMSPDAFSKFSETLELRQPDLTIAIIRRMSSQQPRQN